MADDVHFRREEPGEAAAVRAVVESAFSDEPVVGALVDALRASPDWLDGCSFVAVADERLVGHVLFSRGLLDAPRRLVDVLVLSPLAVIPEMQGRGIATGLVTHAFAEIASRSEPFVFLEGDPRFYGRLGFEPAEARGFRRPSLRIPAPAFQVRPLAPGEPWMTGTLVYSRVFWDLDCVGLRE